MKKAFVIISILSVMLTGCSTTQSAISETDKSVRLSPTPTVSIETNTPVEDEPIPPVEAPSHEINPTDSLMLTDASETNSTENPVPEGVSTEWLPETELKPQESQPPESQMSESSEDETLSEYNQNISPSPIPELDAASHATENNSPGTTESAAPIIDTASIESYAMAYAASLGFVVDTSLGVGNAGYYPSDCRALASTQEGCNIAAGMVAATKNQLNSRFSTEPCDTLVEEAYGLARANCQVVYSHTDNMGNWYSIYVFYG